MLFIYYVQANNGILISFDQDPDLYMAVELHEEGEQWSTESRNIRPKPNIFSIRL